MGRRSLPSLRAAVPLSAKLRARQLAYVGTRYRCPVCGSPVRRWLDYAEHHATRCPVCASRRRHRLAWWFLVDHQHLFDGSSLRVLHWAPELGWSDRLRRLPGVRYLSGDVDPGKAMRELDLTSIDLPDESIDLTLCSHVLEHVPDDRTAMSELLRVLRPGGHALVMVPLTRAPTDEDPSITDPEERRRRFGQTDHVRRYNAQDVGDRLVDAGFRVERYRAADLLPASERTRYGIDGPDVVWWAERPER